MSLLSNPTLVLNRSWIAITTTTVRRALSLLYQGAALAVEPDTFQTYDFEDWASLAAKRDEPRIQAVSIQIRVPEVIKLEDYNGLPIMEVVFNRRNLFRRDHYQCQYCGVKPGTSELSIDHVFPQARGGKSSWDNCVLSCTDCNRRKGNRTPEEARIFLRREPTRPRWAPHIDVALGKRRASWEKFISDRYWNVALDED